MTIIVPAGVKLTRPQADLIERIEQHGKAVLTHAQHQTAEALRRKGVNVVIAAETHAGEPCVAYAPPKGEQWHWVARSS